MFYAERVSDGLIAEKGVFLSLAEFLPYRRKGWEGTDETNAAADAVCAQDDATDARWLRECAAWTAEHGMSPAVRTMLAFHCA